MSIKINYPNDVIETFHFDSREDEAAAIEEVLKRVGPDSEVVILKTIVTAEKTRECSGRTIFRRFAWLLVLNSAKLTNIFLAIRFVKYKHQGESTWTRRHSERLLS